jgi:hypothetical protein
MEWRFMISPEADWLGDETINLSGVGLAKVCWKLNIPRPGRGYWEKRAAGKPGQRRPALPTIEI